MKRNRVLCVGSAGRRFVAARVGLAGLALVAGSAIAVQAGLPSAAGAATGSSLWTCVGATDDSGAFVSSVIGDITSAWALSYAGVVPEPSTFDYSLTDIPEAVSVGSGPVAIEAAITLPNSSNAQLASGLLEFFGLTSVPFDPQALSLVTDGASPVLGLASESSGVLDFSAGGSTTYQLAGSLDPSALGEHSLRLHQRVTFVIDREIEYQGIDVQANTLTFECTSDPLATTWVINPGAPIARNDSATFDAGAVASPSLGGPFVLDVLANDTPSDPARPIDPATLRVVNTSDGAVAEVVDGKLSVTRVPTPATAEPVDPNEAVYVEYPDAGIGGCQATNATESEVVSSADGVTTWTTTIENTCTAVVTYEVCTVEPVACSQATATVSSVSSYTVESAYDPDVFTIAGTGSGTEAPPLVTSGSPFEDLLTNLDTIASEGLAAIDQVGSDTIAQMDQAAANAIAEMNQAASAAPMSPNYTG